jgi:hypothetical protein
MIQQSVRAGTGKACENQLLGDCPMKSPTSFTALIGALAISALAACGGGGGGTATGSGGTVVGTIAGFGSIILNNGVEYDTDGITSCEVDDQPAAGTCEESLAVGMGVSIEVNASGAVTSVDYDDDLEGPATDVSGSDGIFTFKIFGVDVTTTNPGTQWEDFTTNPPTQAELEGTNVEVSGEWLGNVLNASYVEKQDDATHEAEGTVGVVEGTTFLLALQDGTEINVDATNVNLIPQSGDYVEVEGTYNGDIFFATSVELEDEDDFDSDGDAEITGTLAENPDSSTGFSIDSTDVDISNAPTCDGLTGSVVEAEGSYDQLTGVLVVAECEDEEDGLEMECLTGAVTVNDPAAPKVGSVECTFPGTTGDPLLIEFRGSPELATFVDDSSIEPFDLTDVNTGDCVEIEASTDSLGAHVAGLLELEATGAGCESYELEGPVDTITDVSITVLGVTFTVDGTTDYPDGTPLTGDSVEVTDVNGDGLADSVEIEDTSSIERCLAPFILLRGFLHRQALKIRFVSKLTLNWNPG